MQWAVPVPSVRLLKAMSAMLAVAPSAPVEVAPVAPVAPVEASEVPQEALGNDPNTGASSLFEEAHLLS